jgi:ATP/maltotriose-dependent transcriptional regulator MalT
VRVIVQSRAEPSPEYAQLLANGFIAQIGWEELRLTLEETTSIASIRHSVSAALAESLHIQCDGCVAGMVLLLEGLKHTTIVRDFERVEWPETIFYYFTGQVFGRLSEETRDFLFRTAMLPQVSARIAEVITGRSDAQQLLENLYHHQLFIDSRRSGPEHSYQWHALFRVFLMREAQSVYSPADWKILLKTAAEALVAQDRTEEAVPILIESGAWDGAAHSILTQAQGCSIAAGRKRCSTGLSPCRTLSGTRRHVDVLAGNVPPAHQTSRDSRVPRAGVCHVRTNGRRIGSGALGYSDHRSARERMDGLSPD